MRGLSYYSYDKICTLLAMDVDEYIGARNALIEKDLIAFDGFLKFTVDGVILPGFDQAQVKIAQLQARLSRRGVAVGPILALRQHDRRKKGEN